MEGYGIYEVVGDQEEEGCDEGFGDGGVGDVVEVGLRDCHGGIGSIDRLR